MAPVFPSLVPVDHLSARSLRQSMRWFIVYLYAVDFLYDLNVYLPKLLNEVVTMKRRLYRNTKERMVAGVLAGLAEYYNHDVSLFRLGFLAFLILTGFFPGLLLYIFAWFIVPPQNSDITGDAEPIVA